MAYYLTWDFEEANLTVGEKVTTSDGTSLDGAIPSPPIFDGFVSQ